YLGKSRSELLGKSDYDYFPAAQADLFWEKDEIVFKTGIENINEEELTSLSGQKRNILTKKKLFTDEKGRKLLVGIISDITERKRAERELEIAHQWLTDTIEFLPDATFVIDEEKKIIAWNRAMEEMTGRSKNSMIGKGDYEYSIPFYGERMPILIDLVGMNKPDIKKKYSSVTVHGNTLYGEIYVPSLYNDRGAYVAGTASPLFDSMGRQYGAIESVRDITEKKRIEEALRNSESKYRTIFENSRNPMAIVEGDMKISLVNKEFEKLSGYSKSELLDNMYWPEFVKEPADLQRMTEYHRIRRTSPEEVPTSYEFRFYGKAKEPKTVFISVALIPGTGQSAVAIVDMTQRLETERALRESENLYRSIFENTGTASMIIGSDYKIHIVNSEWCRLTGYNMNDLNKNIDALSILHPDELNRVTEYHEMRRRNVPGAPGKYEVRIVSADRSLHNVLVIVSLIAGTDKSIISMLDITDKKKIEQDLIKAKENAERSSRLKSEFLAQMSHEIRTPINTMLNYMQLVKDILKESEYPDVEQYFSAIDKSGDRIIRTIDLILNMSEIQAGSYECVYRQISLYKNILERLYMEFVYKAGRKNLKLLLNRQTDDFVITADQYSLEQILVNLIDNAIKYTNAGSIEISTFRDELNRVCISVADTGIGIADDYLPSLFTPFTQEEQGYTRKYEGSGLGLSLVKKYCEMNNAEITVKSIKGKGTVFTVIFNEAINTEVS
ncbi:MAG: PAS domain S-box protein, partial [Bacteroidota bacterium]